MRRLVSIAILSLSAAACAEKASTDAAPPPAAQAAAQETASTLVAKHLAALGGAERLRAAKTMQYNAKGGQGADVESFTVYRTRPNLFRKEAKKGDVVAVKAFDGQTAWVQEAPGKVAVLDADRTAMMRQHADFDDALLDYEQHGHKVELAGMEDVKGSPAYKLRLTLASGEVEHRYLDARSLYEVKRTMTVTHEGKSEEKAMYFSDYRPVNGIQVNHVIESEHDGKTTRFIVENISYDAPIDATVFRKPSPGA